MDEPEGKDREDPEVAALLRMAGARDPLPDDLRERWEDHIRSELEQLRQGKRRAGSRMLLAVCASVAVVATVLLLSLMRGGEELNAEISLVHVSGDHRIESGNGRVLSIDPGQQISVGSTVVTGNDGVIALVYNDHEVRIRENSVISLNHDSVRLFAGELFVADAPQATAPGPAKGVLIATPHGSVRDIGTQFLVRVSVRKTQATVRQGTIVVRSEDEEFTLRPPPGGARRSTIRADATIELSTVPGRGMDWQWIHEAAPAFDIDGRTALEFLSWAARESGLQLRFASTGAERSARRSLLRGNLTDIDPQSAVEPILASTDLQADVTDDGHLLVALTR